ncbi:hypothetical protein MQX03_04330 [Chryseobacterium aahli]|uniref:hypothetical protein n=1 Tax=Chryseobacterium aahli TaxID=1278643 RepID=UPI001F60322A|nr:hypothetical protein [Chryseobacterium aahli]MCI3936413.1 hypothetical protein [Chryseobacterium aahli]
MVTDLFISLISLDRYVGLKEIIVNNLSLNEHIINSLPEGLWVFCITLTSKNLFLKIGNREINLLFLPLIFSIGLEFFQLFNFTNGRFDFWDIGFSTAFWAIANYLIKYENSRQNIFRPLNTNSLICILSYLIVYLAHVWE